MKTTIYELLGMIKDGKAPQKIVFNNDEYEYNKKGYLDTYSGDWLFDVYDITDILNDEVTILETTITYKQAVDTLFDNICKTPSLNLIDNTKNINITPKKIEKLEIIQEKNCNNNWKWKLNGYNISTPQKIMGDKINQIIDKVKNL